MNLKQVTFALVQSLNSPFFPPHIGAEPGRAKGETLLSPARVQPQRGAGRKGSSGTGLPLHVKDLLSAFFPVQAFFSAQQPNG